MARKFRIQYPGAIYHVINRGNYRSFIFDSEGARVSFLKCLRECCESQGWVLHAWVLMGNHYHLCLETPEANLVDGMRWLQSTFANRFNRFRGEQGHVFQGRYKALLLDEAAVGTVCHYIHLNPVRAGLVGVGELEAFKDSSFHRLWNPSLRWEFEDFEPALRLPWGLEDTAEGRRLYRDELAELSGDATEQKRMGFESMTRGWIQGSKAFRKAVLEDLEDPEVCRIVESEASDAREAKWERAAGEFLSALGFGEGDLGSSLKTVSWKVAVARKLREELQVPYLWIADRLRMGKASTVQNRVSRHRRCESGQCTYWSKLQRYGNLD